MSIRDLDFFYGKFQALKDVELRHRRAARHRVHRPIGLRQVDAAAHAEPDVFALPGPARDRARSCFNGANILDPATDLNLLRAKVGMVFQKPTPFPMSIYDNIAFGVRLYESLSPAAHGRARRMGADQGRDVGRGEGQAQAERAWRFPAASSSGCASRARSR